jgi:hypothetical protein
VLVQEVAIPAVPAGLIGGCLYFLATSWNVLPPIGGAIADLLRRHRHLRGHPCWDPRGPVGTSPSRRRHPPLGAALLAAQAIGRGGNYFNQELFGGPTNLPRALETDAAHRPLGYEHYATFHRRSSRSSCGTSDWPALVWLGHHRRGAPVPVRPLRRRLPGPRIFEELLRVYPAHQILGLRLNLYVASGLFCLVVRPDSVGAWHWRSVRRGVSVIIVGAGFALTGCGQAERADAAAWSSMRQGSQPVRRRSLPGGPARRLPYLRRQQAGIYREHLSGTRTPAAPPGPPSTTWGSHSTWPRRRCGRWWTRSGRRSAGPRSPRRRSGGTSRTCAVEARHRLQQRVQLVRSLAFASKEVRETAAASNRDPAVPRSTRRAIRRSRPFTARVHR